MSRIGKAIITIPAGVTVTEKDGVVTVKGPKGELTQTVDADMIISQEDGVLTVNRPTEQKRHKALHGLYRSLINNMVVGVTDGYKIEQELVGVGYRAAMQGKDLSLTLGFSHPVIFVAPEGITLSTPTQTEIIVAGADKQMVGEVAAKIRAYRPPEPYKGKGVKYSDETVLRKEAKKA